jgi:hypothetical protein
MQGWCYHSHGMTNKAKSSVQRLAQRMMNLLVVVHYSNSLRQVAWLRQKLGPEDSNMVAALKWIGVLTNDVDTPLEAALRFKCLILVAVTLKRRSLRSACLSLATGSRPWYAGHGFHNTGLVGCPYASCLQRCTEEVLWLLFFKVLMARVARTFAAVS